MAVDSSDNVYINTYNASFRTSQVLKPTLQSDGSYVQSKIGIDLNEPHGVAVDGSGNVYIANELGDSVLKETPQPDGSYRESIIAFTIGPVGMAVDGSGKCRRQLSAWRRLLGGAHHF